MDTSTTWKDAARKEFNTAKEQEEGHRTRAPAQGTSQRASNPSEKQKPRRAPPPPHEKDIRTLQRTTRGMPAVLRSERNWDCCQCKKTKMIESE